MPTTKSRKPTQPAKRASVPKKRTPRLSKSMSLVLDAYLQSLGAIDAGASSLLFERFGLKRSAKEIALSRKVDVTAITSQLQQAEEALKNAFIKRLASGKNGSAASRQTSDWTTAKAQRRNDLIDRKFDGTLTVDEAVEFQGLQEEMLEHRRRVAPIPLDAAREMERQLMDEIEKKNARQ